MKKKDQSPDSTIARETPPVQEITLPEQPVAMDGPEYGRLMRQRIRAYWLEKAAGKRSH